MPRVLSLAAVAAALVIALLWLSGGFDQIAQYAAQEQRNFQNAMARTLRALRAGEPGATAILMTSAFAYGFFHAVGPGHGKLLVGGYGVARQVAMWRLSTIALVSSLGQAVTAIVLAYGGLWLLDLTRDGLIGTAEDLMAPLSYGLIAAIGVWLVLRGLRRLHRAQRQTTSHDHHHHHDHGDDALCGHCGHRHGPSLDEAEKAGTLREALVLIAGIAVRPCTGALFVLVITWQMGIPGAGIAAAFAMALGTASVTVAVGLAAGGLRGTVLRSLGNTRALALAMPALEVAAGAVVVALAIGLLLRAV
ncbi:nickel/cobalt transporter [Sulfitobacter sp. S190]|uniref:nickel/cobalt transporter n=1 Tax=Sulfitobacter sp. S190 TaxID=2867022 RepID=UPI0021A35F7A|nr:hypothetical protein [Sulfitobacter sp. S190]UWR21938.1 hypothetical protein K3756_14800 [Sulfitobacter sp. S190]